MTLSLYVQASSYNTSDLYALTCRHLCIASGGEAIDEAHIIRGKILTEARYMSLSEFRLKDSNLRTGISQLLS